MGWYEMKAIWGDCNLLFNHRVTKWELLQLCTDDDVLLTRLEWLAGFLKTGGGYEK